MAVLQSAMERARRHLLPTGAVHRDVAGPVRLDSALETRQGSRFLRQGGRFLSLGQSSLDKPSLQARRSPIEVAVADSLIRWATWAEPAVRKRQSVIHFEDVPTAECRFLGEEQGRPIDTVLDVPCALQGSVFDRHRGRVPRPFCLRGREPSIDHREN